MKLTGSSAAYWPNSAADLPFLLKIILLALVQGISEFFPVSSSGHLLVFQKILHFTTLPLVYDIFLHLGTLLAVLFYFFKDLKHAGAAFL